MARARARSLRSTTWLQGLACGAVVALATPCAVLGGLLLAPGFAALVLDGEPGRPTGRATLLAGGAAAAAPLLGLWQSGANVAGALDAASNPRVLLTCWLVQAGAWLLAGITPLLIRLALDAHAAAQAARLKAERTRYEEDWGIPPRASK
jgi:uncharacterized membrane protein YbhN (UPF0104 family)